MHAAGESYRGSRRLPPVPYAERGPRKRRVLLPRVHHMAVRRFQIGSSAKKVSRSGGRTLPDSSPVWGGWEGVWSSAAGATSLPEATLQMPRDTRPWKRLNVSRAQGLVCGDLRAWGTQTKAVVTSRQSFCFWLVPHMMQGIRFLASILPKAGSGIGRCVRGLRERGGGNFRTSEMKPGPRNCGPSLTKSLGRVKPFSKGVTLDAVPYLASQTRGS